MSEIIYPIANISTPWSAFFERHHSYSSIFLYSAELSFTDKEFKELFDNARFVDSSGKVFIVSDFSKPKNKINFFRLKKCTFSFRSVGKKISIDEFKIHIANQIKELQDSLGGKRIPEMDWVEANKEFSTFYDIIDFHSNFD